MFLVVMFLLVLPRNRAPRMSDAFGSYMWFECCAGSVSQVIPKIFVELRVLGGERWIAFSGFPRSTRDCILFFGKNVEHLGPSPLKLILFVGAVSRMQSPRSAFFGISR